MLFRDLSGDASAGEVVAITGPNGSGKSTFLRILSGLIRPTAGQVTWNGSAARELRHVVGLASPELQLYGELSALENLSFFSRLLGVGLSADSLGERLVSLGLMERDHHKRVAVFSSGMKQRLRLAFALLASPVVLLLDEPGSNLDAEGNAAVRRVIGDQRKRGVTLVATNDPEEAALADRRIVLG